VSTVIYNGVILRDVETLSFDQQIVYDESNTDTLFSVFKIRVASTIVSVHEILQPYEPRRDFGIQTPVGNTAAQKAHDIHARLSEPRKDFWFLTESNPTSEKTNSPTVIDQPLLIASGQAYDEEIKTRTVNSELVEYVDRTPRTIQPNPLDPNHTSDYSTTEYGPFNTPFPAENVLDCKNGPRPLDVSVKKIIGGRSLSVEFEIEVTRKLCKEDYEDIKPVVVGGLDNPNSAVLSNRWHLEESKDENWITTRTMQGTLRVINSQFWPHAMRYLCIPPLLKGYKRARQSFVSDPTDTVLKYRVEDVQAHAAPPYPAIKWSGHHAETASGPNGVTKFGEFHIRLQGPPGVDKQQLIAAAGKVAVDRIQGLGGELDEQGKRLYNTMLQNASVVDVLDQPIIEMRIHAKYNEDSYRSLALRIKKMGAPLTGLDPDGQDSGDDPYIIDGYRPDVWPVPLAYDSETPAGIFNCYLQHPCSVWHGMPGGITPSATGEEEEEESDDEATFPDSDSLKYLNKNPGYLESGKADGLDRPTPGYEYQVQHELPEDASEYSQATELFDFPYTYIELEQKYRISNGWSQLPLAKIQEGTRSASLVRLHDPVAMRVLTLTASRNGKQPLLPSLKEEQLDPNGIREVLEEAEIKSKAPRLYPDGRGREYSTQVVYTYLLERAPTIAEKLRGTSSPLDLFSPDQHDIDLSTDVDNTGSVQWEFGTTVTYPIPPAPSV
jgi:hypothetical protein